MSELPSGWCTLNLSEVGKWGSGGTPKRTNASYYNGEIPWLVIGDLNDSVVNQSKNTITEIGLNNSSAKMLEKGTLLIAMYGSIGKLGITGFKCATNQAIASCRVNEVLVNKKYLFYLLMGRRDHLLSLGKGGAQQNISQTVLKAYSIPLAPLNEQVRIANKLDSILAKIDNAQARLEKIPAILKRFRQSVLAAATSGELTREWRQEKEYPSFSVESSLDSEMNLYDLPESWKWEYLGELVSVHNSQRIPVKAADRDKRSGEYPYYGAFGIIDDMDDYIFDGRYILLAEDGKNLESRKKDISLIAEGKFWVNYHAHVLQANDYVLDQYIKYYLNSSVLDLQVFLTGMDQVKLNRKAMVKIPIPLPGLDEQKEIIRRIESLFSLSDKVEKQYEQSKLRINRLTQSALAKAFRGEIVAQHPDDEPANVLLKNIKIETKSKR